MNVEGAHSAERAAQKASLLIPSADNLYGRVIRLAPIEPVAGLRLQAKGRYPEHVDALAGGFEGALREESAPVFQLRDASRPQSRNS